MIYLNVKDAFVRELERSFDTKLCLNKRISVISDLQMFRPKEDVFVWGQQKGKVPEHLMVYFDNVHILTFNEQESMKRVMLRFWQGFREQYSQKKIKLTPPWLREEVKPVTDKDIQLQKLAKITPHTKAERMAKDIVKNIITAKKPHAN